MPRVLVVACLLVASIGLVGGRASAQAASSTTNTEAVWHLEDAYWRYVKAGDVEPYVRLWHDQFIGWPCGQAAPKRKASIGDWVREIRDKRIAVTVDMTRDGAQDFGDVVIVHYRFTRVDRYPDGRVEGQGLRYKITHTWLRVGPTWQIAGGMCGPLTDADK